MLFSADAWPGLADGSITLTFRTWSRPQAKVGGRYRVAGMLLEAIEVVQVAASSITDDDAHRSGAPDAVGALKRMNVTDPEQLVWRVGLEFVGADDRIQRRSDDTLTAGVIADVRARLERMDRRSSCGPWTQSTLHLIERYPGVVSTALARHAKQDRTAFKLNVRKLKELGLTESFTTGYQLSPRGQAVLAALRN